MTLVYCFFKKKKEEKETDFIKNEKEWGLMRYRDMLLATVGTLKRSAKDTITEAMNQGLWSQTLHADLQYTGSSVITTSWWMNTTAFVFISSLSLGLCVYFSLMNNATTYRYWTTMWQEQTDSWKHELETSSIIHFTPWLTPLLLQNTIYMCP